MCLIVGCHLNFLSSKNFFFSYVLFAAAGGGGGAALPISTTLLKTEFSFDRNGPNFLRVKYAPFATACKNAHKENIEPEMCLKIHCGNGILSERQQ